MTLEQSGSGTPLRGAGGPRKGRGNKKLKWTLIIVGALVLIFLVMGRLGGGDKTEKVATEKAVKRTIVESVNASGKVYPEVEVKISPDISGEVTELNVEEGDSVKKGQVLARIYADIYALQRDEAASRVNQSAATVDNGSAALEALKANLEQAQQSFNRNKSLYDDKVISKSELEQYETSLRSAQANYNAAQQNIRGLKANVQASQVGLNKANKDLSRATLTAPMSGVVSSLKIKKGERVAGNSFNVGTEMMTVADMSVLEVRVDVGENDIVKISIGDSADVEVDAYNNRKFKGVVTKIASSTKTSAGMPVSNDVTNYEVRIRLDPSSYQDLSGKKFPFRPGMNASADIKTKRVDNVLAVPITAVNARVKGSDKSMEDKKKEDSKNKNEDEGDIGLSYDDELEEVVFVLQQDGTVKKLVVKSGIQDINYIEIVSGLNAGDEVIIGPYNAISKTLKTGTKVKVVPKDKLFEK
ncbi:MAG TPA: efflux RND transporter periplasmic adaptor subunit [Chitinophagaceae bacterium]|nr:efflux RND transporter periplasmic adaptor subunit [Chitinophagaceae bacterium]